MGNSMTFSTLTRISLISAIPESQKPEKGGSTKSNIFIEWWVY